MFARKLGAVALVTAAVVMCGLATPAAAKPSGPSLNHMGGAPVLQQPLTPAVPEPGVWVMLLVGFGGLGASLRTRRRAIV